ncbi:MAG: hypothetical protein WD066_08490 [Planctomycetaceae bacterium]
MTPSLDHWREVAPLHRAIGEFLEHVEETHGLRFDFWNARPGTPLEVSRLIDEFLEVDREAIERERRALLEQASAGDARG